MRIMVRIKDWLIGHLLNASMPMSTLIEWLERMDTDGNGMISVRELIEYVRDWAGKP